MKINDINDMIEKNTCPLNLPKESLFRIIFDDTECNCGQHEKNDEEIKEVS